MPRVFRTSTCGGANANEAPHRQADFNSISSRTHPNLTVTSEEKVLNAILMWGVKAKEVFGWEVVDEMMKDLSPEDLFGERLRTVHDLLPIVRFLLLPMSLLEKFERSNLKRHMSTFSNLVEEAINYIKRGLTRPGNEHKYAAYGPDFAYSQGAHNSYASQQYLQVYGAPETVNTLFPYAQLGQTIPGGHIYPTMHRYAMPAHQIIQFGGPSVSAIPTTPVPTIQSPFSTSLLIET